MVSKSWSHVLSAASIIAATLGPAFLIVSIEGAIWSRRPGYSEDVVMVIGRVEQGGAPEDYLFADAGLERSLNGAEGRSIFQAVAGQVPTSGENAGYAVDFRINATGQDVQTAAVTWQFFSVMDLRISGRDFTEHDDRPGAPPVAIISHRLWTQQFGGRLDVVGSTVPAHPVGFQVIGIAPMDFGGVRLGEDVGMWIPHALVPALTAGRSRGAPPMIAFARLKPGVNASVAERALRAVSRTASFDVVPASRVFGTTDHATVVLGSRGVLWIVGASAFMLVASGCAAMAALLVVHYERRRYELWTRCVLGLSLVRLWRLILREAFIVGALGAIGALGLAWVGLRAVPSVKLPDGLDLAVVRPRLDASFAALAIVATWFVIGVASLVPVLRLAVERRRGGFSRAQMSFTSSTRTRRLILFSNVGITAVLLVSSGFFLKSILDSVPSARGLWSEDLWFLSAQIRPIVRARNEQDQDRVLAARAHDLLQDLTARAGVEGVALGPGPIGTEPASQLSRAREVVVGDRKASVRYVASLVGPEYADVLGARTIAGRGLSAVDASDAKPRQVVVTQGIAGTLWPGLIATGQVFTTDDKAQNEVVGVISDLPQGTLRSGEHGILFPLSVADAVRLERLQIVVRTTPQAGLTRSDLEERLLSHFPNLSGLRVSTGRDLVRTDAGDSRLSAWFLGMFGLIGLGVAVSAVYGLVSYILETRRRELAIRLALGATELMITRDVVRAALKVVLGGLVVGSLAAYVSSLLLAAFYPIGSARSALGIVALVATAIVAGATAAAVLGSRRMRTISGAEALRAE